ALDPQLTHEVLDMILALKQQRRDLILVTHEMAFARIAADHVLYIDGGKLVEHGPAEQLFTDPQTPELRAFLQHILS
ncbi:MAG: glutamine ABC transporter ATP-binding protein GlnQ, partial [Anaerolineae bacterium]|nr:glutamine ABC transporter ATP-binding protein GlnQ [Anaerolineae bacterium]